MIKLKGNALWTNKRKSFLIQSIVNLPNSQPQGVIEANAVAGFQSRPDNFMALIKIRIPGSSDKGNQTPSCEVVLEAWERSLAAPSQQDRPFGGLSSLWRGRRCPPARGGLHPWSPPVPRVLPPPPQEKSNTRPQCEFLSIPLFLLAPGHWGVFEERGSFGLSLLSD